MDLGKRSSNFPPLASFSFYGLYGFKNHNYTTFNRDGSDWRWRQDAGKLREEPQSCQFNLKLIYSIRRCTEFNKYRR